MLKLIFKFLKKKIKKIFFYELRHKQNLICTNNTSINFVTVPIINCENITDWKFYYQETKLVSYSGSKNFNKKNEYPLIESWISINNETLTPNNYFIDEQEKNLNENLKKKIKTINEHFYVLPYYTSVFGHFTGDVLGSILYYLEFVVKKHKLFLVTPSEKWDNFFINRYQNKIHIIKPCELLKKNFLFKKAIVLPRMNTIQNYIFSNNILNNFLDNTKHNNKKVFLTSKRSERIENIDEVIKTLKKKNFTIVDPIKFEVLDLLKIIKSCKILISEKASTLNNLHLCRNKPYYIFSSENEKINNSKKFTYAGIYKSFHKGLYNEIYCKNSKRGELLKPYKNQIYVDIKKLNNFF
jgi:hypothetical protein